MSLGQKLRQARQEMGLSQRALCADVITRNMLSQIENGTAKPSMATLQYLAGQLGKPVSFFLEEETGAAATSPLLTAVTRLEEARQLKAAGKVSGAQELLSQVEPADCPDWVRRQYIIIKEQPELAAQLPSLDPELLLRAQAALDAQEGDRALALLQAAEEKTARWSLLMGEALLLQAQYAQAAAHFHQAESAYPHRTSQTLEICYRELEDYQKAYHYACRVRNLGGK